MKYFAIPLGLFFVLAAFLALGLKHDPAEVPSPLIGKPAPQFSLPRLDDPALSFSPQSLLGQVWLLNVWASWCTACREEHSVLLGLARSQTVPLYGMDYKDTREQALRWLAAGGGSPYRMTAMDESGRVGIDYGVYGVPETYVIDKAGIIRYKHIGALTESALLKKILPLVSKLQAE